MPNYNYLALMGNLTREIELKVVAESQASLAIGAIAVNERKKNKAGEIRETPMFIDFEAWGHTAEEMSRYLSKGEPVLLEGRLKLDQWTDSKSGQKRYKHKMIVDGFQRLKDDGSAATAEPPSEDA